MNPKKVYMIDTGFANRLGFNFSQNKGRLLENMVFLELQRRGKEVFYFSDKLECDFIIREGLEIVEAIQVAYQLEASNYEREFRGLADAMSAYNIKRGLLITYDVVDSIVSENDGVEIIPIWRWLLT